MMMHDVLIEAMRSEQGDIILASHPYITSNWYRACGLNSMSM